MLFYFIFYIFLFLKQFCSLGRNWVLAAAPPFLDLTR